MWEREKTEREKEKEREINAVSLCFRASAGCIYATNGRFTVALSYADVNIADNLDDVYAYSLNTQSVKTCAIQIIDN